MSGTQDTVRRELVPGSVIGRDDIGLLLKQRDDRYRKIMGMPSLRGMEPEYHMQATVAEKAIVEKEVDGGLLCPRCNRHSVISRQVQFRAGDEGTNTMYLCTNRSCKNTWMGA